jgi:phage-related tail fiber protein
MAGNKFPVGIDVLGQKVTNVADGTAPSDAVNRGQLDALARNMDFKDSVRVATTANITLSAPQTIDGVAVIAGNRVLVKDQTTASANGIYVVAAGAWARSADYDAATEVTAATTVPVEEGTANGDKLFVLTTNDAITIGSTSLSFTALGGGLTYTAADNTITVSGSTIAVKIKASSGILFDGSGIYVDPTYDPGRYEADVPAGSATANVNHALNSAFPSQVRVYDKASKEEIYPTIVATDANNVALSFAAAPTAAQYRVTVRR